MTTQAQDIAAVRAFVASAAGVSADLVWLQNAGMTRPTGGYLTILLMVEVPMGLPQRLDGLVGDVNVAAVTQIVEQSWSIQGYGASAAVWVERIARLWRVEIGPTAAMIAAGVTPLHAGEVANVVSFLDTAYEPRWVVTLTSLAARTETITDVDGTAQIVVDLSLIRDPDEVVATATITYPEG